MFFFFFSSFLSYLYVFGYWSALASFIVCQETRKEKGKKRYYSIKGAPLKRTRQPMELADVTNERQRKGLFSLVSTEEV